MEFKSKYNYGDKVVTIQKNSRMDYKDCPVCAKTGKLTGLDGSEVKCPKCSGGTIITTVYEMEVAATEVIAEVRVVQNWRIEVDYLLSGRSSYLREAELFATKEEAMAMCAWLNKEEKK